MELIEAMKILRERVMKVGEHIVTDAFGYRRWQDAEAPEILAAALMHAQGWRRTSALSKQYGPVIGSCELCGRNTRAAVYLNVETGLTRCRPCVDGNPR